MSDNDEKTITLRFGYKGESGKYKMSSTFSFYESLGDNELTEIGYAFNQFLSQLGYVRSELYMLMDAVNEFEMEALHEHLMELRGESMPT